MNNITAVICELNPFHNGHRAVFEAAGRDSGCTVAMMSGAFVQRGEAAVFDKYTRAEAAVMCGADLMLELPFPWCAGSGEYFAAAGMSIASSVGAARVVFGSASGDIGVLRDTASLLSDADFTEKLRGSEAENRSMGAANIRSRVLESHGADTVVMREPNDILAVEYLRAADRLGYSPEFEAVKRLGKDDGGYKSATELRGMIYGGDMTAAMRYVPGAAAEIFSRALTDGRCVTRPDALAELEFLYFRMMREADFLNIAETGGGVGERLKSAAMSAVSGTEMFIGAATKKYTNARLRRAALYAVLGVTADDIAALPNVVQVLAANGRGRELLAELRGKCGVTLVTKPASAAELTHLQSAADDLFGLCTRERMAAGSFIKKSPVMI